jgi:zinc transport system ATP-binding protein
MSLIVCRNASFAYEGSTVLSGLNFRIDAGEYLCIVGENGSGKSTLLKGLLGMKSPSSGSLQINLKQTEIGYLPQHSPVQKDFPASVNEVVLSGRLNNRGIRPFYTQQDRASAKSNMAKLGISDLADHSYRTLSGGQQQRVLLARALCATSKLLLLDEPVAGLDPLAMSELYVLINDLNKKMGMTIVMVSHDVQSALSYASHVLHLGSQQTFFGTVAEYRRSNTAKDLWGGQKHV